MAVRFILTGTESTFVLGEYPDMLLEQARVARAEAMGKAKAGINPAQERRQKKEVRALALEIEELKATNTFENIAHEWRMKPARPLDQGAFQRGSDHAQT